MVHSLGDQPGFLTQLALSRGQRSLAVGAADTGVPSRPEPAGTRASADGPAHRHGGRRHGCSLRECSGADRAPRPALEPTAPAAQDEAGMRPLPLWTGNDLPVGKWSQRDGVLYAAVQTCPTASDSQVSASEVVAGRAELF